MLFSVRMNIVSACVDQAAMGQSLLSLSFSLVIIQPQTVIIETKDVITGMRGDLVATQLAQ